MGVAGYPEKRDETIGFTEIYCSTQVQVRAYTKENLQGV